MHLLNEPDPDGIILGASPEIEVPNYFTLIRTDSDTVLTVAGKDYSVEGHSMLVIKFFLKN